MHFWGKKGNVKTKKFPSRKKIDLELLRQRLGHRYTKSLLAGDTANVWEDIELRIDPYPFCTPGHISSMNKKVGSKNPLNPKASLKWFFIDTITSTAPKRLTRNTTFYNYLLIVDTYYKTPKLYGTEKIFTEEVMDKLDIFQSRFRKIDESGLWELKRISADAGSKFTSTEFKGECQTCGVHLELIDQEHQE